MIPFTSLLLVGLAAARTPPPPAIPARAGDHGRVAWFEGSFEAALAEAAKAKKLVFLDFWTRTCGWCKRMDRETYNDEAVLAETKDLVCLSVDAESVQGRPLAERCGVSAWPALVFLEPDGSLRDRLVGFRQPRQFVLEVRRVKAGEGTFGEIEKRIARNPKDPLARLDLVERLRRLHDERWARELAAARELVAREEGFDPRSPDERFAIARKLRLCGDEQGWQDQIAAIRTLDPQGRSLPMRRMALDERVRTVNTLYQTRRIYDPEPVKSFLAGEIHAQVRFDGLCALREMSSAQAEAETRQGHTPEAAMRRAEARAYAREAWKDCPLERVAAIGREFAQSLLDQPFDLKDEDRAFALEVARKASEAAPSSVEHLEILGACLQASGRNEEALAVLRRALELEPGRASLKGRIQGLGG